MANSLTSMKQQTALLWDRLLFLSMEQNGWPVLERLAVQGQKSRVLFQRQGSKLTAATEHSASPEQAAGALPRGGGSGFLTCKQCSGQWCMEE